MNIHPDVEKLDFAAIKMKLLDPLEGNGMRLEQIEFAECEYRRFLSMRIYEPDLDLVPSRLVDEFWHAHILDTQAYVKDCQSVFGEYLHHYPYMGLGSSEARDELETAYSLTKIAYERHFGPYPEVETQAARCAGHACHVPSSCACRSPGACKGVRNAQNEAFA
ncbi:glycine-rich domain-containing protein [Acidihalobacter aeolianus]|uniref:glycine-rich domain-containing protein n=1 Tax=Acidihalobacter aeolianus TaxID=2792603 RepID=UPI0009F53DD4|nr:hypothetical protein [Acidihalobacter aeolianus]